MRITESKLRSIIRSVIRESKEDYLMDDPEMQNIEDEYGVSNLDDALKLAASSSASNESFRRFKKIIKESADPEKIKRAEKILGFACKKDMSDSEVEEVLEYARQIDQTRDSNSRKRLIMKMMRCAGWTAVLYPLIYCIAAGSGLLLPAGFAVFISSILGGIGILSSVDDPDAAVSDSAHYQRLSNYTYRYPETSKHYGKTIKGNYAMHSAPNSPFSKYAKEPGHRY